MLRWLTLFTSYKVATQPVCHVFCIITHKSIAFAIEIPFCDSPIMTVFILSAVWKPKMELSASSADHWCWSSGQLESQCTEPCNSESTAKIINYKWVLTLTVYKPAIWIGISRRNKIAKAMRSKDVWSNCSYSRNIQGRPFYCFVIFLQFLLSCGSNN